MGRNMIKTVHRLITASNQSSLARCIMGIVEIGEPIGAYCDADAVISLEISQVMAAIDSYATRRYRLPLSLAHPGCENKASIYGTFHRICFKGNSMVWISL